MTSRRAPAGVAVAHPWTVLDTEGVLREFWDRTEAMTYARARNRELKDRGLASKLYYGEEGLAEIQRIAFSSPIS